MGVGVVEQRDMRRGYADRLIYRLIACFCVDLVLPKVGEGEGTKPSTVKPSAVNSLYIHRDPWEF